MTKVTVKSKPGNHPGSKIKHIRMELAEKGRGVSVHVQHRGTPENPFPPEVHHESFGEPEEALHNVGKMMGADVTIGDPDGSGSAQDQVNGANGTPSPGPGAQA